ncbi:hypothetical protein CEP54_015308 [Fusarium duplospermum]|uniref:Major facilitator superfamily (MFS) profile domain-containing protein n=1 Tax=Fusarium duplospermum TaxID=1325734 RepID=A0A428NQ37_9HYPO|nr:hypothetical protein CEP54_015308 [Fusarium duplospermum]
MANTKTDVKLNDLHGSSDHIDEPLPSVDKEAMTAKSNELGLTEEEYNAAEKSLVRKLDYTLVPMVWLLYLFNYLVRNNIAQARLSSFEKDLGLRGNQFNVAVSIPNVGYMLMQLPSNMLLTRTRPSIYIPFWIALWSIVSAATAGAGNYTHLIIIRFFLAAGILVRNLHSERRFFILVSSWQLLFSGLIAAGVLSNLEGVRGIAGWQWLFIIEGAGSFGAALIAFIFLPDFPGQKSGAVKWLLTDDEQKVAVERIQRDRVSLPQADNSVWSGLSMAAKDIRTWVFVIMLTANHSAYGFNSFFPTIVKGFKLGDNTLTLVLTAPPYLVATITAFATAWSSDRRKDRGYHIAVPQFVACIGFIISVSTLNNAARYTAAFLYICGFFSSNAMVFSWASSTLNQTPEKRACATAIINLLSQLGNIWSPYFFPSSDGPRYIKANILMMAFSLLSVVTCVVMKGMLRKANRKLKETGENVNLFTL